MEELTTRNIPQPQAEDESVEVSAEAVEQVAESPTPAPESAEQPTAEAAPAAAQAEPTKPEADQPTEPAAETEQPTATAETTEAATAETSETTTAETSPAEAVTDDAGEAIAETPEHVPAEAIKAEAAGEAVAEAATAKDAAEKPAAQPAQPRLANLQPGMVIEGKVTRIERYGAFVNLGLAERRDGLIHISEMSPHRIRRVEDVVQVGDAVRTRVVSVDTARGRIALSLNDVESNVVDLPRPTAFNEPTVTSMAAAFERAYGRVRESQNSARSGGARVDRGDKKRREQETLMSRFRS